jgi:hypothetical protein
MTLKDILAHLEELDEGETIYATAPWQSGSKAVVALEPSAAARRAIEQGMLYLLEVWIAKEVVKLWSAWRNGRTPSLEDRVHAVVHYATYDAYLRD